jgi:N-acetylneuraminic acid mutarotase
MTTRRIVVLALSIVCLGGVVCAQDEDLPLSNWGAPPYWTPAIQPADGGLGGGMLARAEGMSARAEALPSSPLPFVAIAPCRIVDTRVAVSDGFHQPNFADDEARTFPFPSSTDCPGLPATAGAWSLNIQFRPISQLSYLTAYPTGTTMPTVSTLTAGPAAWVQNSAIVPAGTEGSIDIYCQFAGRVVIDINGYYGPSSVVTSLNAKVGDVTLAEGANVSITPSGNTLTIAGPVALPPVGAAGGSLSGDYPDPAIAPGAVGSSQLANSTAVRSLNGAQDAVTIQGSGGITVETSASTVTVGAPSGSMVLGPVGDITLIGAGYTEIAPTSISFWTATSTAGAPSARENHTAVWTGTRMIVWGGYVSGALYLNDGGQYDPVANTWTTTTTTGAPSARAGHVGVWTGSRMVIWGGQDGTTDLNTGGRYDPVGNAWTATTTTGAPSARFAHTAVWTGSRMVVWGGAYGNPTNYVNTGGRYDPVGDSWTAISTAGAPSARVNHAAVWTGTKMVVWAGWSGSVLNDGGQYDPVGNAWTATTTSGAPTARMRHTAVWTGSRMLVWGGTDNAYAGSLLNDGGQYDPAGNAWTAITTFGAPTVRRWHTAVWTGSRMLVWGGHDGSTFLNTGGLYDPVGNIWTATTTSAAPLPRALHSAVWAGSRMIIWGGEVEGETDWLTNEGGQCIPVSLYMKN